tara:strand:+ start:102 stop:344 length:243 start_codon:yes stop_codon:yes gene_type:complete
MQIINAPEDPTLVLNGSEYKVADLDESSKYFIDQIQDLNVQLNRFKAQLHQVEVARAGFVSLLTAEIEALDRQEDSNVEE